MKRVALLSVLVISLSLSGCNKLLFPELYKLENQLNVTYHSDPPGATLYQGSQSMGYCSTTLVYEITKEDKKRGYKLLQGTQAKWVSGAHAEISQLRANLKTGNYQQFTFKRPTGIGGLEADARFGLEVQKMQLMQQQSQAQQAAAYWQLYSAISSQQPSYSQIQVKAKCRSYMIGSTIYTDCN